MFINKKGFTIACVLIFVLSIIPINSSASAPCSVSGYVYSDGEQITPENIVLSFPSQNVTADLFPGGFYIVDFNGNPGETGIFYVTYNGETYTADETMTVESDTIAYDINLHITTPPDHPPNKPTNPIPENNSENTSLNPEIGVLVSDPDGGSLTVSFYNASNDELLDTVSGVANNSIAKITWNDLAYNQSYSWYVNASDSTLETRSDNFNFQTREEDLIPPSISFEQPKPEILYLFNFGIPLGFLKYSTILGTFTIKINATDDGSGIDKVDLTIKGFLSEKSSTLSDDPYEYNWNSFGFGKYNLTAVAYDMDGNNASTSIIVKKFF